jgi:hypothetical protein
MDKKDDRLFPWFACMEGKDDPYNDDILVFQDFKV